MIPRTCSGRYVPTTSQLTFAIHVGRVCFFFNLSVAHICRVRVRWCFVLTKGFLCTMKSGFLKKNQSKLVPPTKLQSETPPHVAHLYCSVRQ